MTTPIHDAVSDSSPARQRLDEIANTFSALEADIGRNGEPWPILWKVIVRQKQN
ncbi:hypothetical protein [Pectobacterium carotovorum]|uniref:hypothetical protein n=1 Tax=Pectobacterium carotovorum TaxID=554 RepID=UPI001314106A|nr:hypothetical protein [Pectobacterium carotovorum]